MKRKTIAAALLMVSAGLNAQQPYGPYNQQYTMNQQFGSTNWYSSPLGMGVAQAGVTLIGGLVNALSRPDPVSITQQPQVIYVGNDGRIPVDQNQPEAPTGCQMRTLYDQSGNPLYVKVCQ